MRRDRVEALEHELHAAGDQVVDRRRAAAIGHVHDLGAGHELEQLAADVAGRAVARRRIGELAGIGLGVRDQVLDRVDSPISATPRAAGARASTSAIGWKSRSMS